MDNLYRSLPNKEFSDIRDRILYEDNHYIIFCKRAGEIVQGDKTEDEPLSETIKAFISQRDNKPGAVYLGVPHRLDRPTSGATIFAKTSKGLERINQMLKEGEVHKTYWALVGLKPKDEERELVNFLYRDEKKNKTYVSSKMRKGYKEARLKYKLIGATNKYYLLEIELYTGRHHQIRAQLSYIGSPIKGDLKYGAPRSNKDGSISLHARRIEFIHPIKKIKVEVEAPISNVAFPGVES